MVTHQLLGRPARAVVKAKFPFAVVRAHWATHAITWLHSMRTGRRSSRSSSMHCPKVPLADELLAESFR